MEKQNLSWKDIDDKAMLVGRQILDYFDGYEGGQTLYIYPVPRGGIYAALATLPYLELSYPKFRVTSDIMEADLVIDDIVDSGATKIRVLEKRKNLPFFPLIEKKLKDEWVVFPWEEMSLETGPQENIIRILEYIGEDPTREGLKETPSRVVRSYDELFSGYKMDVKDVVKTFEEKSVVCDEMVVSKHIEFYSTCEHHMIPFYGVAHVGYVPGRKVIGLSKLARIVDIFSRRLQVQERLTTQITDAITEALDPKGSACVIEARHLCCMARGVGKQGSSMVTSSLTGVFRKPEVRQEFLSLIRG